jgi:Ca-activated chloride channel family protein
MIVLKLGKHLGPALLCGVLALFSFTSTATAQTIRDMPPPPPIPTPKPTPKPTPTPEPKAEDLDVVRVNSNLVMVPVSVVNANGEPVLGLGVKDFSLDEQGRRQEISDIGNPDQVPLDIAILFDISSSVSQKGFFAFQQTAASRFLKQVLKPADRAAVFTIAAQPQMVEPLAPANRVAARILSIPAATSSVPTAFYDTVAAASKYLNDNSAERHRRVIVVISDGDDNFSNLLKEASIAEVKALENANAAAGRTARLQLQQRRARAVQEVQKSVQQADAAFYAINPGGSSVRLNEISMRAQNAMQSIAESTGGNAYIPNGESDLERVFGEIGAELRGQYLLQYYSNLQTGTQFRTIKVGVPGRPELRIRARQGYYPKSGQ